MVEVIYSTSDIMKFSVYASNRHRNRAVRRGEMRCNVATDTCGILMLPAYVDVLGIVLSSIKEAVGLVLLHLP